MENTVFSKIFCTCIMYESSHLLHEMLQKDKSPKKVNETKLNPKRINNLTSIALGDEGVGITCHPSAGSRSTSEALAGTADTIPCDA